MDDCCSAKTCELDGLAADPRQRRVLIAVLVINAVMFVTEFTAGVVAGSTALMADAVDMLGDAFVYGLSLFALSRGPRWKAGAALAKGGFILLFGGGIAVEVAVRLLTGAPPSSGLMLAFGGLALCANVVCLSLLWRYRATDVNMSSTFECSRNDVIANVGVLAAAGGVALFHSPIPDLMVGSVIAALFLRSAIRVLRQAWPQFRATPQPPPIPSFTIAPRRAPANSD
jgi:cation diffusion facilitator family transporter